MRQSPPASTVSIAIVLAERAAQQVGHAGDELVASTGSRLQRLPAREGEQPLRQRGRALRAAASAMSTAGAAAGRRPSAQAALEQVEIAEDDGQQVVEVVRDAAGELADRLHLLRLQQLLRGPVPAACCGLPPLGEVAGDLGEAEQCAVVVADRRR